MTEHDVTVPGALTRELDELGIWTLAVPDADFADTVLGRHGKVHVAGAERTRKRDPAIVAKAKPSVQPTRRRRFALSGVAVAVVVAVAIWILSARPRDASEGSVMARTQRTVSIGGRAVAVLEPGTRISWRPHDADAGGTTVQQSRGATFFRVESGARFDVQTPAGDIRVTGTCFSVEVKEQTMQRSSKSAALGAGMAALVTVMVYEGSTVFANGHGEVTLLPGQGATATISDVPRRGTSDDALRVQEAARAAGAHVIADLREHAREQAQQIEGLQRELAMARSDVADEPSTAPRRFGYNGPPLPEGFSYYAPTPEALLEMAECGVVAWDQPPVWADDQQLDPEYFDAIGVSDEERTTLQTVFEQFRAQTVAEARRYWVELGGDPKAVASIDPSELIGLVDGRTDHAVRERTREQMAMERAGLTEVVDQEGSATEQFLRWDADLGNAFESMLAEQLGAGRAKELRRAGDGWSGKRSTWANLCADR